MVPNALAVYGGRRFTVALFVFSGFTPSHQTQARVCETLRVRRTRRRSNQAHDKGGYTWTRLGLLLRSRTLPVERK
jgi:hypothetical protein